MQHTTVKNIKHPGEETLIMATTKRYPKTRGYHALDDEERAEILRLLRRSGTRFRASRTKEGEELVLLKVSVSGLIPNLVKMLTLGGAELIDWFEGS